MREAALVLALVVLATACGKEAEDERGGPPGEGLRAFAFDSGGAHHIQGYGAWIVRLDRRGALEVEHQIAEEVRSHPDVTLDAAARDALWAAIAAAGLPDLEIPERPGVPDEIQMTFRLTRKGGDPVEVVIWQNDLSKWPKVQELVDRLRATIEAEHGVKPVF